MLCGSERCEVVREWHRGECAALALGQNEIHWNTVRINTEGEATTRVMGACRSRDQECRMVESGCY
jgi:hypothetical protein